MPHQALLSFNSGEVNPYLRHRIDFEKTSSSAERMENFLAMPYGGVIKRPGLKFLALTAAAGENSRLRKFMASDGSKYLLHFTADTLKVYRTAAVAAVAAVGSVPAKPAKAVGSVAATFDYLNGWTWPSPFDWGNSLRDGQMVQLNDVAFLTHPRHHPVMLSRVADDDWTLEFIDFSAAPMLDENLDDDVQVSIYSDQNLSGSALWATGTTYAFGDHIERGGVSYTCHLGHNSGDGSVTAPPTGSAWEGNWHRTNWSEDSVYPIGSTVRQGRAEWVCIFPHSSTAGGSYAGSVTKPRSGSLWRYFWQQRLFRRGDPVRLVMTGVGYKVGKNYLKGDFVYSGSGSRYLCLADHLGRANREPGQNLTSADAFWDYKGKLVPAMSPSPHSPGTYWHIRTQRDASETEVRLKLIQATSETYTPWIAVQGAWDLFTEGAWAGTVTVEKSTADGVAGPTSGPTPAVGVAYTELRAFTASLNRSLAASGEETEVCFLRLYFVQEAGVTPNSGNLWARLVPRTPDAAGQVLVREGLWNEMVGVASGPLLAGTTARWSKGAFGPDHGYPRAIVHHESRLGFAGTASHPVSLWLSASDDLLNFSPGARATAGIFVTLATGNHDPIRWMASQRRLFLGLQEGEWVCGSETSDAPLSPTNFAVRKYSSYGSVGVQALIGNDSVLFLERKGIRLREMAYSYDRSGYDSADLSRLASHLLQAGVSNMDWQQTRESGLWAVTREGVLLHLAYNRQEHLAAWSRHTTAGGVFRDVVVLPSPRGDDHVFFIVDRTHNGVTTSCLEHFPQFWQAAQENSSDGLPYCHLDGVSGTGTAGTIPHHLCNQALTLVQLSNATPAAIPTVSPITVVDLLGPVGASFGLATSSDWQVGLPIVSRLDSLPVDVQADTGTTQARKKRSHKLLLSLFRSRGGALWLRNIEAKQAIRNTQPAEVLRTGWVETIPDAGALDDLQLRVYHDEPFPFCLRAAVLRWNLNEP